MSIASAAKIAKISYDEAAILQMANLALLLAVAAGKVDLNVMARQELASRGLSQKGTWVGFERAASQL